ncbi:hypothetical protein U0035_22320 [Niabella yanshanensis]|uniref:Uncharacterized protein n=1 Tax=Niabella yanshanensis TaxID=577386 RepID=A0ABZ0W736_9BACT|nr:hypothetical protein [Niabella yanshanensis]WQD38413.1 hypothetical protein U0035_22320 [Niabella yanshanensis]
MLKLKILLTVLILLAFIILVFLIVAIIRKSKGSLLVSLVAFFALIGTGYYTLSYTVDRGTAVTINLAKKIIDPLFPPFNSDQPDTEANRKNFRHFLQVDITPDITNIYCFDDAIGQDADYMFSFNCDTTTAAAIIKKLDLSKDSLAGNNPESLQHDFDWWNKKRINELTGYSRHSNIQSKNIHKRFWCDTVDQKAYYFQ